MRRLTLHDVWHNPAIGRLPFVALGFMSFEYDQITEL